MADAKARIDIITRTLGDKKVEELNRKLAKLAKGVAFLGGAMAGAGAAGVAALTTAAFGQIDALAKQADVVNASTEKLAAYRLQAELTGSDSRILDKAFEKLNKRIGEFNATGAGAAAPFLKQLNIDTKELASLRADEQFEVIAEAIRGMDDRGQQLAATSALLGDRSRSLITLIDAGEESFAQTEAAALRFGVALSRVDAAKIEQANDATLLASQRFKGLGNELAVRFAPVVTAVSNAFINQGSDVNELGDIVDSFIDGAIVGFGIIQDALFRIDQGFTFLRGGVLTASSVVIEGFASIERATIRLKNAMNDLPFIDGDDVDPNSSFFSGVAESLRLSGEEARMLALDMNDAVLPSQKLQDAFLASKRELEASAQATAEIRNNLRDTSAFVVPDGGAAFRGQDAVNQDAEIERERERQQRLIETIEESFLTREQREIDAILRRQEIVNEYFDNLEVPEEQRRKQILAGLEQQHQQVLNGIVEAGLTERERFMEKSTQLQVQTVLAGVVGMTQGVANGNRALFELNKAAAIAEAAVSMPAHISKTMAAYPYPLSVVMGAIAGAASLAQINAIRSASFGGGTTPSVAGTTPTLNNIPVGQQQNLGVSANPNQLLQQQVQQEPRRVIEVNVMGDINSPQTLDSVVQVLKDAIDADEVVIRADSAQADVIRNGGT
ncbi:MAG: hypothetical protein AAFR07_05585 [Pseudomonadota bacterium]